MSNRGGVPTASTSTYNRLAAATPEERLDLVMHLLEAHPDRRLVLPIKGGQPAVLQDVDLSAEALKRRFQNEPPAGATGGASSRREPLNLRRADLRGADLRRANLRLADLEGADLREADLSGAILGGANLHNALLEGASLRGADLAGVNLRRAALGGADLSEAMMEDADLSRAGLRFSNLQGAILEGAVLQYTDLWGANLEGAFLATADLQHARLHETNLSGATLTGADLRNADLRESNLRRSDLTAANLQEASLAGANLEDAVLRDARLQGMTLTHCNLLRVHLSGAWLDRTRLSRKQLGEEIGEELAGEFEQASYGYLALERNFEILGDPDAASWAYRKKRRMQKKEEWKLSRQAFRDHAWGDGFRHLVRYLRDQFVEGMCDYGESISRVLGSMVLLYLSFVLAYGITRSVVRVGAVPEIVGLRTVEDIMDLAIFSLISMTTAEGPSVGLQPINQAVYVLTGLHTLLSIALTGLLGFVLGNRIRR